jgi:hypothetical protein
MAQAQGIRRGLVKTLVCPRSSYPTVKGTVAVVAPQSILQRERQLFGGGCRLARRHRHAAQVVALGIRDAPLPGLLADDQLPLPSRGDRVERIRPGRHRQRAELQRLVRDERGRLVGAEPPFAAVVRIDIFPRRPALERHAAVGDRNRRAVDGPLAADVRRPGLARMYFGGLLRAKRDGQRCQRDSREQGTREQATT